MATSNRLWLFGYGSNMNAEHTEKQKGVRVLEWRRCRLPGYRLRFNLGFLFREAEPAFANIEKSEREGDEVHGVGLAVGPEDAEKLDTIEAIYKRQPVKIFDYDNNCLEAFAYVAKKKEALMETDGRPTDRYLALLVHGAKSVGLRDEYVRSLAATPTHSASPESLRLRQQLLSRPPEDFPAVQLSEIGESAISILGFVFDAQPSVYDIIMPRGYETSKSLLHYYHGLPFSVLRTPPFPTVAGLKRNNPDGLEYVLTWLDARLRQPRGCVGRVADYEKFADDNFRLEEDEKQLVFPKRMLEQFR